MAVSSHKGYYSHMTMIRLVQLPLIGGLVQLREDWGVQMISAYDETQFRLPNAAMNGTSFNDL